jgi:hypothetical protein
MSVELTALLFVDLFTPSTDFYGSSYTLFFQWFQDQNEFSADYYFQTARRMDELIRSIQPYTENTLSLVVNRSNLTITDLLVYVPFSKGLFYEVFSFTHNSYDYL